MIRNVNITIIALIALLIIAGLISPVNSEAVPEYDLIAHGVAVNQKEAQIVAENWIRFVVERDGDWGGAKDPSISEMKEFKKKDMFLGYYVSVKPQGYIIISPLKDFAPIKAYSTTSDLDPEMEEGMTAILKDITKSKIKFVSEKIGLDKERLKELRKITPEGNRLAWSYLLEGGSSLRENLQSINPESAGLSGPLLEASWHQGDPYNRFTPFGYGCSHTAVGCTATAIAQVMHYYRWPQRGIGSWTDSWGDDDSCPGGESDGWDLYADFTDVYDWANMPNSNPTTEAQITAVANLSYEVGVAVDMDYGCCGSGAALCNAGRTARDALEKNFLYDTYDYEPDCEDYLWHTREGWFDIIKGEINVNRPMPYAIYGSDFGHTIVVDGYDDTAGYMVHANYGWNNPHTTWYALDQFDCDSAPGWQGGCHAYEESMIRQVFPRNGFCGSIPSIVPPITLSPLWHPHYVYCDTTVLNNGLTIESNTWVQFLGGPKGQKLTNLNSSGYPIQILGDEGKGVTFLYAQGARRGLKVYGGSKIKLNKNGSMRLH